MEWLLQLWSDSEWYHKVYLAAGAIFVLSLLIFLLLLPLSMGVAEKVGREYDRLCSQHLFISFRKRKQSELLSRAKMKIGSNDSKYTYYQIGEFTKGVSILSFGLAFWFFVGSFVYDNIISTPVTSEPSSMLEVSDDSGAEDEYYYEGPVYDDGIEDNIHHVDPHWVDGYQRSDGTVVEGYWCGGETGYERSNPDGDVSNNLNYDSSGESSNDGGSIFDIFR